MSNIPKIKPYPFPSPSTLVGNVVNWQIDPTRAVLLVHDMQRFFVEKIPFVGLGEFLLRNASMLRERCKAQGVPVAYTAQPGDMTASERGLLKCFWGAGMKADPRERC